MESVDPLLFVEQGRVFFRLEGTLNELFRYFPDLPAAQLVGGSLALPLLSVMRIISTTLTEPFVSKVHRELCEDCMSLVEELLVEFHSSFQLSRSAPSSPSTPSDNVVGNEEVLQRIFLICPAIKRDIEKLTEGALDLLTQEE